MFFSAPLVVFSLLAGSAFAHPGHSDELDDHALGELYRRHDIVARTCSSSLRKRHVSAVERVHARRSAILAGEVAPNMLVRRQATSTTATMASGSMSMPSGSMGGMSMPTGSMAGGMNAGGQDQGSTSYHATATADTSILSAFPSATQSAVAASETTQPADSGCVLSPETVVGPYYIIGEEIRSNLIDGQEGIPFYAEFAVYDINDCAPLANAAVDIWSCNATGEYSGFVSTDSSNYDTSQYNGEIAHVGDKNDFGSTITDASTALRGQQLTNSDGLAQFTTLLPGWYSGRTTHTHVRVHVGGEVTSNGTYIGGNLTHTGQTFYGEDMYTTMQSIWPYTLNTISRLSNANDSIYTESNGTMSHWNLYYVVDGDLTKGVIGHINLFIDTTADNEGINNMPIAGSNTANGTSTNTTASAAATTSTNGSSSWTAKVPFLYIGLIAVSHLSFKFLKTYA